MNTEIVMGVLVIAWMLRSQYWKRRCKRAEERESLHQQYVRMLGA